MFLLFFVLLFNFVFPMEVNPYTPTKVQSSNDM